MSAPRQSSLDPSFTICLMRELYDGLCQAVQWARLTRCGILQEATGYKRNRVFRYAPYIAIFGDHPPETPAAPMGGQP